ncbi:MAG: prepilin-type N-terminal cleavage/methylation domain-containing protein [Chthoniobacterales bacterium]|nr:prepilin-type N-terminal cleavage/methylation domain-containing protein [Chthoniobacterales bacterium]
MRRGGFTLLEVLVALGMFTLAVGGLALALDRAFGASNMMRRDADIRQQLESLVDQAMVMPIEELQQGQESGPDALGVEYFMGAELTEDFRNMDDEELDGLWRVTVRARWLEQGEKQEWKETFLRYQP